MKYFIISLKFIIVFLCTFFILATLNNISFLETLGLNLSIALCFIYSLCLVVIGTVSIYVDNS